MSPVAALIVAAGQGRRFGGEVPKVFVPLAGAPLLLWSVRSYDNCPDVTSLLVAVAQDHLPRAADMLEHAGLNRPVRLIAGGDRRQDTVFAGLCALAEDPPDIVAIHDGARPLVDPDTIARSIQLARSAGGCVTATPMTDTVKRAAEDGTVLGTPDRRELWRAQTPQTFQFPLLLECYQRAIRLGWEVTDDASVLERSGHPVKINPGPATNIKITTPEDLRHAEALLRGRAGPWSGTRVGHGYDAHALVPGRPLILGGVPIAHVSGLAGHSDADVLFHAVCDALLGAAAAGDIGAMFPDTDPAFAGADSAELCRQVAARVRSLGFEIGNVDATVIAQRPRLAPYIAQMRQNIAAAMDVPAGAVSVKATTTERLGFEGREEGIAASAVVLLTCPGL